MKNKLELPAILLTTGGIIVSIVLSIVMPDNIYEFVTTAAGLMLLYNWLFILASFGRILSLKGSEQFKRILGSLFILTAIGGTLFHHTSRPGFFLSIAFLVIIALVTLIMRSRWKKTSTDDDSTLFKKI